MTGPPLANRPVMARETLNGHEGVSSTDVGNANRLIATHGQDLRYVAGWGWHAWDGRRWARDDLGRVYELAKDVARRIYLEAAREEDPDRRKTLGAWAKSSESAARIRAMVELARTDPAVAISSEAMDTHPWLLTVENGTIDLRTGKLGPHRRADLGTKLAPVTYAPDAAAPAWQAFLDQVLPDSEVLGYLRRLVGYSLTGTVAEHILPFLYGTGANGKSTLLRAVLRTFGDYGRQADASLLLETRNAEHPTAVARLAGSRLVVCIEAGAGRRLAEVMVKTLTGGDRVAARFLHQDFFEFDPTWTVLLAANHKPIVRGTDHATWRRIHLVPFTVTIPGPEQDHDLPDKLDQERSGILAWAVQGCLEWQAAGLQVPSSVEAATSAYRAEMDTLGDFLEECCDVAPDAEVLATELYSAYRRWSEATGGEAVNQTLFGRMLNEHGFEVQKGTGGVCKGRKIRCGLRLQGSGDPAVDGRGPSSGSSPMKLSYGEDLGNCLRLSTESATSAPDSRLSDHCSACSDAVTDVDPDTGDGYCVDHWKERIL